MSSKTLFETEGEALGRNGLMRVKGVVIGGLENEIVISPVTSKGKMGRCYIAVPRDEAVKVANAILRA